MTSFWPISAQLHVAGLYNNIKAYFHCTRLPNKKSLNTYFVHNNNNYYYYATSSILDLVICLI